MKNFKFLLAAGLFAMSATVSAQIATSSMSTSQSADTDNYSRFEVQYNPLTIDSDGSDMDLTGVTIGFLKGYNISSTMPLFLEWGARVTYAWGSESIADQLGIDYGYDFGDFNTTYIGITIPVNVSYKYALPNTEFVIVPFAGLTFKGNIIGKSELDWTDDIKDYAEEYYGSDINWFDDDDTVDDDHTWNRFQIGYNLGVGVDYKKWYFGISYGSDITELCKDTKTSNYAISVGYSF